jgi:hypothetical protein
MCTTALINDNIDHHLDIVIAYILKNKLFNH